MALAIERVAIGDLHEDPANARKHGKKNVDAIRSSLKQFGQVEPLVVQKSSGKVIGGNGRLSVMRDEGWDFCDVVYVDVDNMSATALGIALNRSGELGEWDEEVLPRLLSDLRGQEFDVEALGWEDHEVQEMAMEPKAPEPPGQFPTVDDDLETDHQCPKCGYEWSGGCK